MTRKPTLWLTVEAPAALPGKIATLGGTAFARGHDRQCDAGPRALSPRFLGGPVGEKRLTINPKKNMHQILKKIGLMGTKPSFFITDDRECLYDIFALYRSQFSASDRSAIARPRANRHVLA
jgi:hypothetical protein